MKNLSLINYLKTKKKELILTNFSNISDLALMSNTQLFLAAKSIPYLKIV